MARPSLYAYAPPSFREHATPAAEVPRIYALGIWLNRGTLGEYQVRYLIPTTIESGPTRCSK